MNLQSGCALKRERARDGSSLLCRPVPLVGDIRRPDGQAAGRPPSCAPALARGLPSRQGGSGYSPGAATRKLPLFPFAGLNLIRFHGSRINGLSFASFDGQHSDKMAPVYTAYLLTQP